ncbi:PHP domain-containing protein [archaeon]|nr:PHP domain-containing protein [archaeon]
MRFDLHTHTNCSKDGIIPPLKLIEIAKKRVDGIAVTDHDTMKACNQLKNIRNFIIIPGMEIKIKENNRTVGELIGLFLTEEIRSRSLLEVIDEIRSQNGLITVSHPFRSKKPFKRIEEIKNKVDAIEVFNSRCLSDEENKKALNFARKNRLSFTAGSDAHTSWEVGKAYTLADVTDAEGLRKAILKRKTTFEGQRSNQLIHFISPIAKAHKKIKRLLPS